MRAKLLALLLVTAACAPWTVMGATTEAEDAGSNEGTSSGQDTVLTVGIAQDLDDSLDPYQMTAAGTREVMFNVFEGLVKPDANGDFIDAAASSHSVSEDGLTYTFTLRDGVVFHNGETMDAADVLYSVNTCAAATTNTTVAAALSDVTDLTASGDEVIFTLAEPNSDFLSVLSSVYIIPEDYTDSETQPVGTGPYRYVSRSVQENVILERNDDYYGETGDAATIICRVFEDSNALMTALEAGSVDLAVHLTLDQVNTLTNGYQVIEGTMNLVQAVYLNNAVAPFDNELVRQALCYAVDVDSLLALTADGHGTKVGSSMYPAFGKYFDESLADTWPYDPEKAAELLAEAGYGNGLSFTIKVPSNYTPHVNTAVVLTEMLAQVGITVNLELVDWQTWLSDVYQNRNFEATVVGFDASYLSPNAMLARWESTSGKNLIGYNNPEYDETLAAAQASTDDEEQTALYRQCLQILADTAANVYLQDLADFVVLSPDWTGYTFYPLYVMDFAALKLAE